MPLTNKDLKKIAKVVDDRIEAKVPGIVLEIYDMDKIRQVVIETTREIVRTEVPPMIDEKIDVVLHRIADLQELVLSLRKDFDFDFTVVTKKTVKDHAVMLQDHENRITKLEDSPNK